MNEDDLYKVMLHFGGEDTLWFDMDEVAMIGVRASWFEGRHHSFQGYEDGEMYYVDMRSVRMIHVSKIGGGE